MGFLDDIIAQQNAIGGMLGGLPATSQYADPESLTPVQKQTMGLAFPAGGTDPIVGLLPQATQTPAVPAFGAGATPTLFANPPGTTPGNPALPSGASPIASDEADDDAPAKSAANAPASPLAIGNYQMPRIGPAAAFTPDPAALPVNAQPTQGQGLPGPAAATAPSIGDKLMTGYENLHHGGGLIGSIVAAVTGKRNDAYGVALQQQAQVANMTARALIAKGVDPQTAIAAVQPGNTEMLKTLLPALSPAAYTQETDKDGNVWNVNRQTGQKTVAYQPKDDKFQHFVVKNPDGSEAVKSFNTKTGEVVAVPNAAGDGARPTVDPDSTGPERMKQLQAADPNYARRVQAAVNGDIQLPTQGQAARSPAAARFTEDVLAVSGSTSASDFATRAATRKDYASGVASRVTKSLNTTIEHAQRLDDAIDKLGNYTYLPHVLNAGHDLVASNFDPKYQAAKSDFESAKEAFIKELDFTLSGGHSSVSGSAELRDKINRADSPEALHAAIQTDLHLLSARLDSHTKGFNEGTKSQRDPQDFLYPKNRASFNKLMGSKDTSTGGAVPGVDNSPAVSSAAPAAPQTALAPGNYAWSPDKGLAAVK